VVPAAERPAWLDAAWQRIREHVAEGRQAFVVCPRIGGDESEDKAVDGRRPAVAVLDLHLLLAHGPLSGLRVEVLHGRMPPEDKDAVMQRFAAGEVDVLVATTVIEVGVDVPNASVMVVMDAERFGVSQLHQLRGRIGRGRHPGLCLLVTDAEAGSPSRARLDAVAATSDGFELSRVDLEHRREGDVLGADQSGRRSSLRLLRLLEHEDVIASARAEAGELVERDLPLAEHPALRQAVVDLLDDEQADFLEKA
jgi:ATP-dependent DNA helicase RecG